MPQARKSSSRSGSSRGGSGSSSRGRSTSSTRGGNSSASKRGASSSGRSASAAKRGGSSSGRSASAAKRGGSSSGRSASASGRGASASKRGASSSGRSASASSRGSSASGRSAASRKAAASKGGKTTARRRTAAKASSGAAKTAARGARGAGVEAKSAAELREALRKNLLRPMEMVLISRDRIEDVLGEAVDQGRVTARDAQRITQGLVKRGQRQTSDVLKDLENLLGKGRDEIESRTSGARGRAVRRASPALAQADRVRRAAGVGPNFPITGYDDLTAAQIQGRLSTLTPAELRKVRDHERRGDKRKTVLNAIESKLG